ncbi:MAG: amino acid ABC transporter permease [Trueperaceae bacterium]
MELFLDTFFNLEILREVMPLLLEGLRLTLVLTAVIIPLAALAGLLIAALQSLNNRFLNFVLVGYIDFLRSIPPLVLLIFIYNALPFLGLRLGNFEAVVLALVLNGSSFFGEIFRAGIESVPAGQREAARSSGLNAPQALIHVIIPQGARNVLPDLVTNILELTKQTSLASVVALQELLRSAQIAQGLLFNPTPLVAAALMYFILLWPLVRIISRMQREVVVIK